MSKNYELGDVKITSAVLTNADGSSSYSFIGQLVSASVYEDLEYPVIRMDITLLDSINIIDKLPIIGEEAIELSFLAPYRDKPTTYKGYVYNIEGYETVPSGGGATYTLKCVSMEHKTNGSRTVDRVYEANVDSIVKDILKNVIKTEKKLLVEETKGIQEVVIPKLAPYAAIDFLRQRAVAKRDSGGVFLFYENQDGLHFKTIESLVETGKTVKNSFEFTHSPVTAVAGMEGYRVRNIIKFSQISRFDTAYKIAMGTFKTNVKSFDVLTKQVNQQLFNLENEARIFESGKSKNILSNTKNLLSEIDSKDPLTLFTALDSSKMNNFMAEYMSKKNSYINLFNQTVVRCLIYGDNFLAVGNPVTLHLPDASGTKDRSSEDKTNSGTYIVSKLRHMITLEDTKYKYHIAMDCNKVGLK